MANTQIADRKAIKDLLSLLRGASRRQSSHQGDDLISGAEPKTRESGETEAFLESKATLPLNNSPDFITPKSGRSQHMVTGS